MKTNYRMLHAFILGAALSLSVHAPAAAITTETENLRYNLSGLSGQMLFGVQINNSEKTAYDAVDHFTEISGKKPGLIGAGFYELSATNGGAAIQEFVRNEIIEAHREGAVITLNWHPHNYVTGGTAWTSSDPNFRLGVTNTVQAILPGGEKNEAFQNDLNDLAAFIKSLKDANGKQIPVILRPFHEVTGKWFWWGRGNADPADYISLFRYTVHYLKTTQGVDQILVAFAPSASGTTQMVGNDVSAIKSDFLLFYPGDDFVDIIGLDAYKNNQTGGILKNPDVVSALYAVVELAQERNKIPAMCEGFTNLANTSGDWWTHEYLSAFKSDPVLSNIKYAQVWRSDSNHSPLKNTAAAPSFAQMVADPYVVSRGDVDFYRAVTKRVLSEDTFDGEVTGTVPTTFSTTGAVTISDNPTGKNKSMWLGKKSSAGYANAIKLIDDTQSTQMKFRMKFLAKQTSAYMNLMVLQNKQGETLAKLYTNPSGEVMIQSGTQVTKVATYVSDRWSSVAVDVDLSNSKLSVMQVGSPAVEGLPLASSGPIKRLTVGIPEGQVGDLFVDSLRIVGVNN